MASQSKQFKLTPEQKALSLERKAKKQRTTSIPQDDNSSSIIERSWIPIEPIKDGQNQRLKVLTWNLLAQCLVRRELFPTSDCLKASQRQPMLRRELLFTKADILCLQEVDRLEILLPILEQAGYTHHYAAGPGKKHGCLIAFKAEHFTLLGTKSVSYDEEEIGSEGSKAKRCGKSFRTKNIGTMVSLQTKVPGSSYGVVVATTHLFWHPMYTYERARQAAILVRETSRFMAELGVDHWPCIIAGDFNFPPDDPTYSLLVGDTLLSNQEQQLSCSRVVHASVDPSIVDTSKAETDRDEDAVDPDRTITNARLATPLDGILSPTELAELYTQIPKLCSAYDVGVARVRDREGLQTFGNRVSLEPSRRGGNEPMYTSYTHYWKTVLDYIFILEPTDRHSSVVALLSPYVTTDLEPGLPQKGVSSSDHIALAAELSWPN